MAAGLTRRIRLMTTVLVAPLHPAGIVAKQAASLDALSGGRLTLGLGVGIREDDFRVAPAGYRDRGRRFEAQLVIMKRVWTEQAPDGASGPVGPPPARPGGPELLIGGRSPVAVRRVGRWADGYLAGNGGPVLPRRFYDLARESWQAAGRAGRPRFVAGNFFALGPHAAERAGAFIRGYYPAPFADTLLDTVPTSPEALREAGAAFADAGLDELIFWPCLSDLDQVDRLADVVEP